VAAKYILAALAAVFAVAAATGRTRAGRWQPAHRTWLLIALIFAAVSAWLAFT
jgi:hypothetical protein